MKPMTQALDNFRARLARRDLMMGTYVSTPDTGITELLGDSGFDFLWLDGEHSTLTKAQMTGHLIACRAAGIPGFVRIPWSRTELAKPVLDMGADGIIIPQLRSYEEAKACVEYLKLPPHGERGWGPVRAADYGINGAVYLHGEGDRRTLCMPQIEDIGAVRDIEKIAAIEEIDILVIGPMDMSGSLGMLGDVRNPKMLDCYKRISEAAVKNHMPILVCYGFDTEFLNIWLDLGATMFCCMSDYALINSGVRMLLDGTKELFSARSGR